MVFVRRTLPPEPLFSQPPRFYHATPALPPFFSLLSPPQRDPFPNLAAGRTSHQPNTPKSKSNPGSLLPRALAPSPPRRVRPPGAGRTPPGERSCRRSIRFPPLLGSWVSWDFEGFCPGVQKFIIWKQSVDFY